jgi:glutathione S-transferase
MPSVVSLLHGWGHDAEGSQLLVAKVNSNALTDNQAYDTAEAGLRSCSVRRLPLRGQETEPREVIFVLDSTRELRRACFSTLTANRLNDKEDAMKLYYSPGACSLSPRIVAREAGIPIDLEKVDLKDHKTETGQDYMTVNPKGYVPALRFDDGSILTEGPAIVQYLADQKSASGLAPAAGAIERYRLQEWLTFIGTELHKTLRSLFNPATSSEAKETAKTTIAKKFTYLNDQLANKQYLMGNNFTVADAYAFTVVNWTNFLVDELPRH